jgi:hypothetical protein
MTQRIITRGTPDERHIVFDNGSELMLIESPRLSDNLLGIPSGSLYTVRGRGFNTNRIVFADWLLDDRDCNTQGKSLTLRAPATSVCEERQASNILEVPKRIPPFHIKFANQSASVSERIEDSNAILTRYKLLQAEAKWFAYSSQEAAWYRFLLQTEQELDRRRASLFRRGQ